MVEKDVEYAIKNLILSNNDEEIGITNEFQSDGIIRYKGKAIGILEFKNKKNLINTETLGKILCQALCYYYKLIQKEDIQYSKPFYLILGDDNEIIIMNIHQLPNNWVMNKKWGEVAPSKAGSFSDLLEFGVSALNILKPIYFKYDDIKELKFGFHLLLSNLFN